MQTFERRRDHFLVSTDSALLDLDLIHGVLKGMMWSIDIPLPVVRKAIAHSLCFGVYDTSRAPVNQVGFCRVVTDYTKLAYLDDVFIIEAYRGQGLSKLMLECVMAHPALQDLSWVLATADAHGLYSQFGFTPIANPAALMQIRRMDIYRKAT